MTGKRITAFNYYLDHPDGLTYAPETRLTITLDGFVGELTPDICKFTPTEPFDSEEAARNRLEPQLIAWRTWVMLQGSLDVMNFRHRSTEAVAWPIETGNRVVMLDVGETIEVCGRAPYLEHRRSEFPPFPPPFTVDERVELGTTLIKDAELVPHHALHCGYALLTLVEQAHGNRPTAAQALGFELKTLNDVGALTSVGGEGVEARKFGGQDRIELTDERRGWLLEVLRELVRRQGQFAAGAVPTDQYINRMPLSLSEHLNSKVRRKRRREAERHRTPPPPSEPVEPLLVKELWVRKVYRWAKSFFAATGVIGGIIFGIDRLFGPPWPTGAEIKPGEPEYTDAFVIPFSAHNRSILFNMHKPQFHCDLERVGTENRGFIGDSRVSVISVPPVPPGAIHTFRCPFDHIAPSTPLGRAIYAKMYITVDYKTRFILDWPVTQRYGPYSWNANHNPPRWIEGESMY